MGKIFGTDGVRGIAVTELTCELALNIGRAAALVLTKRKKHKPTVFIGKDTRVSSDIIESALASGICSAGGNVQLLGVVPTPAVPVMVKKKNADAGMMITAAHNSFEYNGIRIFDSMGFRISEEIEEQIEELILNRHSRMKLTTGAEVGRMSRYRDAQTDYIRYVMKCIKGNLTGMRIAVDCANGSASSTAKRLFEGLGATVLPINAAPNGVNINDGCGSSHIKSLMQYVAERKCHAGLAFDGDGGRCLAVDEKGELVDGDKLTAICAKSYKEQGRLKKDTAVVSVMSNLGFKYFAKSNNINILTAKHGSRYVLEKMLDGGYNLGGEQNGNLIFLDDATTGDGQLTGAKVLEILADSGRRMSELASVMEHFPQVIINVKIRPKDREVWKNDSRITDLIEQYESELGENGRIVVRESGSEPMIKVMLEGRDFRKINEYAVALADRIRERTINRG